MKILLIATNRHGRLMSRMDAHPLPIGLAYVAGHLDPERHTVKVMDLMFADDYLAEVAATVNQFQPDLVGVSLRNLDNNSYIDNQWALPTTKEVIAWFARTARPRSFAVAPLSASCPRNVFPSWSLTWA